MTYKSREPPQQELHWISTHSWLSHSTLEISQGLIETNRDCPACFSSCLKMKASLLFLTQGHRIKGPGVWTANHNRVQKISKQLWLQDSSERSSDRWRMFYELKPHNIKKKNVFLLELWSKVNKRPGGINKNCKMRSSDNHPKLCNLSCETFILITSILRTWKQISLFRSINPVRHS